MRLFFFIYGYVMFNMMEGHQRKDDIVEDFCDSVQAKSHTLFGRQKGITTAPIL